MRRTALRSSGASPDEIEHVYRERAVELERVAAAIVRDRDVARDVAQDAFATIVRKSGGFARRGSLDAWVWRAVVNTALNRRKATRRHERLGELATANGRARDRPLDAGVLAELAALPDRQRLIVFLRYYADRDYATIGAALGSSTGTVASTLNSAHQTLRRQLVGEERQ